MKYNSKFIIISVLVFISLSILFLSSRDVFQSPESESPESESSELISCFSPDFVSINDELPHEEGGPIPRILNKNASLSGDCVIYSTAVSNFKINPLLSAQEWYDGIRICAMKKGYYPSSSIGGVFRKDVIKLLEECKAPLSAGTGKPETFTTVYLTYGSFLGLWDNRNPIDCPPFGVGDGVLLDVIGPQGGHAVYCRITTCGAPYDPVTLVCDDRDVYQDEGMMLWDVPVSYTLSVDNFGEITLTSPNSVYASYYSGAYVNFVTRPNI
ncbi:hypothetical protein EXS72_02875 [Candidatus Pacearchaeota archaeon]|nr:hypothetical protein [Candidatus Pacearchaeota archaeon]